MRSRMVSVAVVLVVLLGTAWAAGAEKQIRELWDRALEQLDVGESGAALQTAREAVRTAPRDADAWAIAGYVRQRRGDMQQALAAFRKAVRLAPRRGMLWTDLSFVYLKLERYADAEQTARRAISLSPELAGAHRCLATALWSRGKLPESVEAYRAALRLDPTNGRYKAYLGEVLGEMGREPEAQALYRSGLDDLNTAAADAYTSLAWSLQNSDDMPGAVAAARKAVDLSIKRTTRGEACNALAYACMYDGQLPEARRAIEQALEARADDPYFQDTAAILALLSDDLTAAEKYLAGALADKPDYASPTVALLYARQGKRAQALAALDKVEAKLRTGSAIVDDYYLSGKACLALGEPAPARRFFTAGARKHPKHPWGVEMAEWLRQNP